jgi:hypothetical protein
MNTRSEGVSGAQCAQERCWRIDQIKPHQQYAGRGSPQNENFGGKALEDPLCRVPLFLQSALILIQDLIDDRHKRIKLGSRRRTLSSIPRWYRMHQNLRDRLAINPKMASRSSLTHPVDMARSAHPAKRVTDLASAATTSSR